MSGSEPASMALRIRFLDQSDDRVYRFDDDMDEVVIGRNAERCHVVVPQEMTQVGREHCALRRRLGRYRLVLNGDDPVFLDGKPAIDGEELSPEAEIQLGSHGPTLVIMTVWPRGLPDTQIFDLPPQTPHGMLREVSGRQRAIRRLQLVIGLLVLAAVGVGIWAFFFTQEKVEQRHEAILLALEGELAQIEASSTVHDEAAEELRQRLAEMRGVVDSIRPDLRGLAEAVAGIGPRMEGIERKIEAARPKIQYQLRRAEDSTYLVLIKSGDVLVPQATAWVVGPALLATNAHVAGAFPLLSGDQALVVRSSGESPRDFVVRGVRVHPGFDAFGRLWQEHVPTRVGLGGGLERLNGVPACDVALLEVDADAELGAALPLAEQAVVEALGAGDVVGFVGYPLEDMAGGAVNLKSPSPTARVGHITGVTNFFLGRTRPEDSLLVQHSMTAVGGTSGSPIIDDEGRVVAIHNAGNFIFVADKRIPGADVNFAQRIDLLRELLEGRADEAQAERTRRWEQGIAQFRTLKDAAKKVALEFLARHLAEIEKTTDGKAELVHDEVALMTPDPVGVPSWTRKLEFDRKGIYVIFAWSTTGEDIDLFLLHADEELVLRQDLEKDSFPVLTARTEREVDVRVRVAAGRGSVHGEFSLEVYFFAE